MRLLLILLALASGALLTRSEPQCARAADTSPQTDYCYELPITLTNASGSTLTDYAVRVPSFPAPTLINSTQMDTRAWDILPILSNVSNEVDLLAQGLSVAGGLPLGGAGAGGRGA